MIILKARTPDLTISHRPRSRLRRVLARAMANMAESRTRTALRDLSDRQLADIGMTRADIALHARRNARSTYQWIAGV